LRLDIATVKQRTLGALPIGGLDELTQPAGGQRDPAFSPRHRKIIGAGGVVFPQAAARASKAAITASKA
jgi:hypothetical protein